MFIALFIIIKFCTALNIFKLSPNAYLNQQKIVFIIIFYHAMTGLYFHWLFQISASRFRSECGHSGSQCFSSTVHCASAVFWAYTCICIVGVLIGVAPPSPCHSCSGHAFLHLQSCESTRPHCRCAHALGRNTFCTNILIQRSPFFKPSSSTPAR